MVHLAIELPVFSQSIFWDCAVKLCFVVSLGANVWSRPDCRHMYYWEPVGALISTVLSQMILGTRVYVIYRRSKWIAALLITVLSIEIGIGGFSVSTTGLPPVPPGPPGMKPPCGSVIGPPGWYIAFWAMPIFYDALAFFVSSLTAWKAYEFWLQDISTPLFTVIWRDGVLYFFAIFTMNVANIIIFVTVPKSLRPINLTPTLIFEIVLSCRLLLNLRGMNEKISSSNVYQKPTPGPTRSDPSTSRGSKGRVGLSFDRGTVVEAFEMSRPQPIQIHTPRSGSLETFSTRDKYLRADQILDIHR
ncbi:hypothetical protein Clacol_008331 [Clathrus columnatus]|uniref:Uncharacterized protein n=1 Tax=Clathrus columnatus TaxID=1419009 RepID=A0AAV5ALS0_9AGAM|nr:hypothetical protein Clacol_008331 [Clathrus columnatus]